MDSYPQNSYLNIHRFEDLYFKLKNQSLIITKNNLVFVSYTALILVCHLNVLSTLFLFTLFMKFIKYVHRRLI
jgi:hypothetical protein